MEPGVGKQELDALFVDQRPVLVRMLAKVVGCANLAAVSYTHLTLPTICSV